MLYLLYLDRYHMGEEIFLKNLARTLAGKHGTAPPAMIVHGSGEAAERVLEGEGLFPERRGGVLQVTSPREVELVDRAVRQFNKKLVDLLTDEIVPAVGIQGINRNVLRLTEDGTLVIGNVGWIEQLIEQKTVPVISAVAYDVEGQIREVNAAKAATGISQSLPSLDVTVVFFTKNNRPGIAADDGIQEEVTVSQLPAEVLPEPDAVREVARSGLPVLVTDVRGLVEEEGPVGTAVYEQP